MSESFSKNDKDITDLMTRVFKGETIKQFDYFPLPAHMSPEKYIQIQTLIQSSLRHQMYSLIQAYKDKEFDEVYNEVNAKFEDVRILAYNKVTGEAVTKRLARSIMQKAQLTYTV